MHLLISINSTDWTDCGWIMFNMFHCQKRSWNQEVNQFSDQRSISAQRDPKTSNLVTCCLSTVGVQRDMVGTRSGTHRLRDVLRRLEIICLYPVASIKAWVRGKSARNFLRRLQLRKRRAWRLRPSPILVPYLEHVGRRRRPARQIASSIFNKAPKGPGGFVECRYKVNFDVGQVKQHRGVHQREEGEGMVERKVGTRKNEEDETKTKRTRWKKDGMNPFFVSL